jgi:hypothetical protein
MNSFVMHAWIGTDLKVEDERLTAGIEQAERAGKHRNDAHDSCNGRVLQPGAMSNTFQYHTVCKYLE